MMICKNCGAQLKYLDEQSLLMCEACGSTFSYKENANTTNQFKIDQGVLVKFWGENDSFNIPTDVLEIGDNAFENCSKLNIISIPDNVRKIGKYAFKGSGLKELLLPNSIESIGVGAFQDCSNLKKITIEHLSPMRTERVFKGCVKLSSVEINKDDFYISIHSTVETTKHGDHRPTLYDFFQGTPYLNEKIEIINNGYCINCGGILSRKKCNNCGLDFSKASEGCYIATFVYGSYDCDNVVLLRNYRDQVLKKSVAGRIFIRCYYALSPKLIYHFGDKKWFVKIFKNIIDKFVNYIA